MTTMNHLSNFVEIDSAILDELEKTADNLLEIEHLDFDNTIYLAKVLFCLKDMMSQSNSLKGHCH